MTANLSATLLVRPYHHNGVTGQIVCHATGGGFSHTNVDEYSSLTLCFRQNTVLDYHNILWYKNSVIDSLCTPRENRGQVVDLGAAGSRIAHVVMQGIALRRFVRRCPRRSDPLRLESAWTPFSFSRYQAICGRARIPHSLRARKV